MEGIVECCDGRRLVHQAEARGSVALTVLQDPRTPCTSRPTRPPSTLWAEMRAAAKNTILLQQVRGINDLITFTCR
jgi:hypothetical protein